MQTFNNYLLDIAKQDGYTDDLKNWIDTLEQQTLMDYADDYAKDCIRLDHERIVKGINKRQEENYKELGTDKHDWCYEECVEVVNDVK